MNGEIEYGFVRWVSDGDIIVAVIGGVLHSVRYIGIDAPAYTPYIEFMGPVAKTRNTELVVNKIIKLIKDVSDQDKYGQLLRYVVVDNIFVNNQLIQEGLAKAQPIAPNLTCSQVFEQSEKSARQNQLGIWKATPTRFSSLTPTNTITGASTQTPSGSTTPSTSLTITPTLNDSFTPSATTSITVTPTSTPSQTTSPESYPGPETPTPIPTYNPYPTP